MSSLVEPFITRAKQSFAARISDDDSPEEFAEEMRDRLDQDMCSELFFEDGRCKITKAEWKAALDEIYELALLFAYNHQDPELSLGEFRIYDLVF